jgi:hypothetical protein
MSTRARNLKSNEKRKENGTEEVVEQGMGGACKCLVVFPF